MLWCQMNVSEDLIEMRMPHEALKDFGFNVGFCRIGGIDMAQAMRGHRRLSRNLSMIAKNAA